MIDRPVLQFFVCFLPSRSPCWSHDKKIWILLRRLIIFPTLSRTCRRSCDFFASQGLSMYCTVDPHGSRSIPWILYHHCIFPVYIVLFSLLKIIFLYWKKKTNWECKCIDCIDSINNTYCTRAHDEFNMMYCFSGQPWIWWSSWPRRFCRNKGVRCNVHASQSVYGVSCALWRLWTLCSGWPRWHWSSWCFWCSGWFWCSWSSRTHWETGRPRRGCKYRFLELFYLCWRNDQTWFY